jgi:hypothetical protein
MNWKKGSSIGFSVILVFYALLYMATKKEYCDDLCEKVQQIDMQLKKNRPFVYGAYQCGDSNVCVAVRDTLMPYNWNLLADTVCIYLKTQSLFNYKVTILKFNMVDTLGKQTCP